MAKITNIDPAGDISSILFACNVNAVRSAMAEAMVKIAFPGKILLTPVGLHQVKLMVLPSP